MAKGSGEGSNLVNLINSIVIDPSTAENYSAFEREMKEQLKLSTRKFEKLKTAVAQLIDCTKDIEGRVRVEDRQKQARRYRPVPYTYKSIRLIQYILSSLIYLGKGDDSYVKGMKPSANDDYYQRHPTIWESVKNKGDEAIILNLLINKAPGKFITDNNPAYDIRLMVKEILTTKAKDKSLMSSAFFSKYKRPFDNSMYSLTIRVLQTIFDFEGADTDGDVVQYMIKGKNRPLRIKMVDKVTVAKNAIDHSLTTLKDATRYILSETKKDSSFIQQILNESYLTNVSNASKNLIKKLDTLDELLDDMSDVKKTLVHTCWSIKDNTSESIEEMNRIMDNKEKYQELLFLARDVTPLGNRFFDHFQKVFQYFADFADSNKKGHDELLDVLEKALTSHFSAIDQYLKFVPDLEKKMESFRKNFSNLTLIEDGQSELYKTVVDHVHQVYINFMTSTERGKKFHSHVNNYQDFDTLYKPLYGDKIKGITDPIIDRQELFPAENRFNITRYIGKDKDKRKPDAILEKYGHVMKIKLCVDAILDFYGNILENNEYAFDAAAVKDESKRVREKLNEIIRYNNENNKQEENKE